MTREEALTVIQFLQDHRLSPPMLPVLRGFACGKDVEWLNDEGVWEKLDPVGGLSFCYPAERYRIVEPPSAPRPRPWLIQEVPLEAWFRSKLFVGVNRICAASPIGVEFSDGDSVSLLQLFQGWEFTSAFNPFQDDAEWLPCGKVQDA